MISLRSLISMIGAELKKKPIIKNNKFIQNGLLGDTTYMRAKLFKPKIDLKTGIKKMIKSIK